jgi:hypothetical protein
LSTRIGAAWTAPSQQAPANGRAARRRWAALLAAGWLGQAAFRIWLTRHQTIPSELPDATGYLIAARSMTGGLGGHFVASDPEYQGGYPLLLMPAFWLSTNPVVIYRLVMIINGLLNALVMPLAFAALRRMDVARRPAYGVAHVAALLPAVIFYSQFPLADAVLPVLVLGWLLLLHRWLAAGAAGDGRWYGIFAGLTAAYAYAVHGRGAVIAALQLAVIVAAAARRWVPRRDALLSGAVLAVAASLAAGLNELLLRRNYPSGAFPVGRALIRHIDSLGGLLTTAEWTAGKLWYQVAATGGVAALGLAGLAVTAVRTRAARDDRVLAAIVLAATLGIGIAFSVALPDQRRVDTWVNGRYLAPLAPVLFLVGAAMLAKLRPRTLVRYFGAAAALTAVLTEIVIAGAGTRLTHDWFSADSFPEISFLTQSWTSLHVMRAAAIAITILGCGCLAVTLGRAGRVAALSGAIALAVAAMTAITGHITDPSQQAGPQQRSASLAKVLRPPGGVIIDHRLDWHLWVLEQYEVTWTKVGFSHMGAGESRHLSARTAVVAWQGGSAQMSWPAAPPGWRVTASDRTLGWVEWQRKSWPGQR